MNTGCKHFNGSVKCDKGWIVCNPNYCKGKAGYIECDDYETEATGDMKG